MDEMNCKNCGAPRTGYWKCEYCGTIWPARGPVFRMDSSGIYITSSEIKMFADGALVHRELVTERGTDG